MDWDRIEIKEVNAGRKMKRYKNIGLRIILGIGTRGGILMKWLNSRAKQLKEKEMEERSIGYKLTKSEMTMLRQAKQKDSHFTDDYVKEFGEYNRVVNLIRERRKICEVNEKPRKRDLGLGVGLGIGMGILTMGCLFPNGLSTDIAHLGVPGFMLGILLTISFLCFCIIMGLALQKEG